MKLKVKAVDLSTGGPLIAVLDDEDAKKLDLKALDRIRLKKIRSKREIITNLDISSEGIKPGQIGLFSESLKRLNIKEGVHVDIEPASRPRSIDIVRKKLDGHVLTKEDLTVLVRDILHDRLSEVEITYFVAGVYTKGFTLEESAILTKVIVDQGFKLNLKKKIILNKHCSGGVPGNRTSMIVVPIIAAAGFTIPKTSSRAITSPAGTADVMEIFCPVSIRHEKIKDVVKTTGGCIIWQSAFNPHGADEKLIKVRHPLNLDPEGLLLASIMAKKKAVGATHVIIDIPCGEGAKFDYHEGKELKKKFKSLGNKLGIKVKVVITDGSQPIGCGIGPALEAKDVLSVLKGDGPGDLLSKSVFIATELLKMAGVKKAREKVTDIINSKAAYKKFLEIIKAQGGRKTMQIPSAKYFYSLEAPKGGVIKHIDNKLIAKIARLAGSPEDKTAGIYLNVRKNNHIHHGDILFTVYSNNKRRLEFAKESVKKNHNKVVVIK
ncbi:MAG: thymidine phosphorylase [Nanoarchaeota archaeon]|nr:thymidine phosphorylase [Nanoarchaeota archaeon]